MAFARDDLAAYEKQAAVQVDDKSFDPFNPGTTPKPEPTAEASAEATPDTSTEEVVITEPTEQKADDGSTTETKAEPVAATDASPEGEKDPEVEDPDGRPRSRAQERIEELVAERNALRKYGEYLLNQVEDIRKGGKPAQTQADGTPAAPTKTSNEDPVPTLEDAEFDSIKFAKMQNEWIQKQVNKQVESAVRQIETRQSETAVRQAFENRATEFRNNTPDFDLVIANPALPALAPEAARVVIRSDNGPAIAYHLAKNPDLAIRVARMDPVSQAAAIGRIEEQIVRTNTTTNTTKEPSKETKPATTKTPPAKVTKAPPPPKPVSGSGGNVTREPLTMEEFVAKERERKFAEREAKMKVRKAYGR